MTDTEKDAARYRWLITGDNAWRVLRFMPGEPAEFVDVGMGLQRAIDSAMRRDYCNEARNVHNPRNVYRNSTDTPDHLGGSAATL